ncbi:cytochrome ubiquinol oxidase subunit I [Mesobaculum littorinae]|uniref:Cytochrome ubiquinol oxidase subunit I n=1 Tax=Mesobaculum littorinae TaxID=2486419 RepID=A0A438ADS9_9RHOB|nr:cbb3-type cytochrome c oxidase subunit I [Mesobaculum littorinae]RVV96792.1 cytochrome ubiquinol oxidase subunit I [Mesobaculum littorinae]
MSLDAVLGALDWQAIVFVRAWRDPSASELIGAAAGGLAVTGALAAVVLLSVFRLWRPLWSGWLTSLDHKKIGIMYIVLSLVMLLRAVIEAALMRLHQLVAVGQGGPLSPEHFAQLFSTHGTIMIFFMAMPLLTGIINYVMPLQIGARDVSFPLLNAISLALTAAGAALVMVSLVIGRFSTGGWSGYATYTELAYSMGEGVDYWIWAVTLSSLGSTLSGLNFAVTIYKKRCPGMTLFRMPLFCWTTLCTSILMIFAMAPLTAATVMLALDRYAGFHFFTNDAGGNMMNYANLFWLFGHPEVYILILPAFGVYSEVFATFSGKTLYGYRALVFATMCIAVLSFTVWLHHFFTMGQSANINAVFGIATMTIGIPTGVKVYEWLMTMVRGRIRLTTPMLFAVTFLVTFVLGGLTGILLANPTIDFSVHNSLFLVAHFHNMLIPGLLFGMIAAVQVWFPKAFGFRLHEGWGVAGFVCWVAGFYLAFMPLYALGLMGAMRRTSQWARPEYGPWLAVALLGAVLVLGGVFCLAMQLFVSIRRRKELAVPVGDPWDGRTLEWACPAPPPEWNFTVIPKVASGDAFTVMKREGRAYEMPDDIEDIEMPANSAVAPVICVASVATGFAVTWHIWWLAVLGLAAGWGAVIARSFVLDTKRRIPAATLRASHAAWLDRLRRTVPVSRAGETDPRNDGLAEHGA